MKYENEFRDAKKYLAEHRCTERVSRSFKFRNPKSSCYAYSLTWTPGSVTLAGDCGEMTITHYHALWELDAGLRWLAESHYDYLLGKTSAKMEYSAEKTANEIVEMANDDSIRVLKEYRYELRDWRKEKPVLVDYPQSFGGLPQYRADLTEWRDSRPVYREEGLWSKISDKDTLPSSKERWTFKKELEDDLYRENMMNIIYNLGIDDYYGGYEWCPSTILKIECMMKGAAMALLLLHEDDMADYWMC